MLRREETYKNKKRKRKQKTETLITDLRLSDIL